MQEDLEIGYWLVRVPDDPSGLTHFRLKVTDGAWLRRLPEDRKALWYPVLLYGESRGFTADQVEAARALFEKNNAWEHAYGPRYVSPTTICGLAETVLDTSGHTDLCTVCMAGSAEATAKAVDLMRHRAST